MRNAPYGRHATGPSVAARRPGSTLVEEVRSRKRRKNVLVGIVVALVIVLVAVGVGVYTYFATTNSKLDLAPSNASEALTAAQEGEPSYVLCSIDLGISPSAPKSYDTPENATGYMLVRVDVQARSLTFVTIPANTIVRFSNGEYHPLYMALDEGAEAELVRRVADLAGVGINHYVTTTADGVSAMVDLMGGVDVTLDSEVDDPYSGTQVLMAGESTLNGSQAVQLLRAQNIAGGSSAVTRNRVDLTCAALSKALSGRGFDVASLVSDVSHHIDTDLTASDLLALADAFTPFDTVDVWQCTIPGSEITTSDDKTAYDLRTSQWEKMMALVKDGEDPNAPDESVRNVDASQTTVEVRNGTLTTGAASQMADILRSKGFQIDGVGNTNDNTIYSETLVVYTSSENSGAAQAVVDALGCGRVVNGGDFYHSNADVISIVGSDWTPA